MTTLPLAKAYDSADDSDHTAIESVVAAASRAPSIHNTQPWRWIMHDGVLDVFADRSRQLQVADHEGHGLLVSCGAAIELTQLALHAHGWVSEISLLPDDTDADLLARMHLFDRAQPDRIAADKLAAANRRRSERRAFGAQPISEEVIDRLRLAAASPGISAYFPVRTDETLELAVAISRAEGIQRNDPAYATELAEWTRHDERSQDGVPPSVIPHVLAGEPRHTDIPLRDYEIGVPGEQLITPGTDEHPLIAIIFSESDTELQYLQVGQAMMRIMIQAELEGIASCALSQSVDLLAFRTQLSAAMSWTSYPQMMLRLGHKPESAPAALTSRRPVNSLFTILPNGPDREVHNVPAFSEGVGLSRFENEGGPVAASSRTKGLA